MLGWKQGNEEITMEDVREIIRKAEKSLSLQRDKILLDAVKANRRSLNLP